MDSGEDAVRAVNAFDRTGLADVVASAERDRRRVTDDFPLVEWPRLEVERYALGAGQTQPFCWMLEYGTDQYGSIRAAVPPSTSCTATTAANGDCLPRCAS
jgi:5-methylcytosine-specific restriction protein B